jgi:alpha-tubulin suppressor-like RCC1 family protein
MSLRHALVLTAAAISVAGGTALADSTVTVQTLFESGRQAALDQVTSLRRCSLSPATPVDQRDWILNAKEAMLADLQASPHELSQADLGACVTTDPVEGSVLHLSVPVCVHDVTTTRNASLALLTASAKHLGVTLDRRAAQLATSILDATRRCDDDDLQLDASGDHTCLLRRGRVTCFGNNSDGQIDVPDLVNPRLIATGSGHSCALDSFGVKCWGASDRGQQQIPGLWNVRALAAGGVHTCAIHDDGVICWGDPTNSGMFNYPTLHNPREIGVGLAWACAIDDDGVKCWGRNNVTPPDIRNPHDLRVGDFNACATGEDGRLACWGSTLYGETRIPQLDQVRSYDPGEKFVCALLSNRVRCWGSNDSNRATPVQLLNPRALSLGDAHACAVDDDGVKCWGSNEAGQLSVPPELAHLDQ